MTVGKLSYETLKVFFDPEPEDTLTCGVFTKISTASEIAEVIVDGKEGVFLSDNKFIVNTFAYQFISKRGTNDVNTFTYKLPKIPEGILNSVLEYFKQTPDTEAIVNILYSKRTKRFFLQYPKDFNAGTGHILYNFKRWALNDVPVIQIHSHGLHSAYFSSVDDTDEMIVPGLYGVIGNLDTENPTMQFRFSGNGYQKALSKESIFKL